MKEFTIYDTVTGECYGGHCHNDSDAENQRIPPGHALWLGVKCDRFKDKVVVNRGMPECVKRPPEEIAARRRAQEPITEATDLIIEALRRKGIDISPADLAEVRQDIKIRQSGKV